MMLMDASGLLTALCRLLLVTGIAALQAQTFSSTLVGSSQKLAATVLSSLQPVNLWKCFLECSNKPACLAFNYNAADGVCELLNDVKPATLSAAPGWKSYRTVLQPTANTLNPCASNPCAANKVCVRYMPPARVILNPLRALNYSVKGYACSAHQWLLDRKNQGKTDCFFVEIQHNNFPYYDIYSTKWYFHNAFDAFVNYNALSLQCSFLENAVEQCWLKSDTLTNFPGNLYTQPGYVYWYPTCR